jgi:NTP pyrophosphatase (non-canonical NTP hydrolase)
MNINDLADEVHRNAEKHGFHGTTNFDEYLANMCNNLHGEVTELWDAHRSDKLYAFCDKAPKCNLTCVEEELADIVIRTLDLARQLGVNIEQAVLAKHEYNKTRPFKHGRKN